MQYTLVFIVDGRSIFGDRIYDTYNVQCKVYTVHCFAQVYDNSWNSFSLYMTSFCSTLTTDCVAFNEQTQFFCVGCCWWKFTLKLMRHHRIQFDEKHRDIESAKISFAPLNRSTIDPSSVRIALSNAFTRWWKKVNEAILKITKNH